MQTLKENVCVNQIIGKSKENIIAECDVIIPDIKPDILSTIDTNGNVCIYKKEILDGKIRIDGGVQVYIMYLADDENSNVRGINTFIDFSKIIEMENINSNMNLEASVVLNNIECKILNGRKISIKAILDVNVCVSSNDTIEFIKDIEEKKEVQILRKSTVIDSLLGNGFTKVYAKDTIVIDNNDNLAEIVKLSLEITNKEIKTSYNKVLVKSDLLVKMVYLTEDGRLNEVQWKIPVMGFIDMQNVSDDNLCDVRYEIKNILLKPNSIEEHSVYAEIELEINCNVYEKKNLDIIQDLYSPYESLNVNQKIITVIQDKKIIKNSCSIKEKMMIPELKNNKICNSDIHPKIVKQKVYNDKIVYEGEIEVKFMYISNITNRIEIKITSIPFNTTVDCVRRRRNI